MRLRRRADRVLKARVHHGRGRERDGVNAKTLARAL
jgi:hypothetical protein